MKSLVEGSFYGRWKKILLVYLGKLTLSRLDVSGPMDWIYGSDVVVQSALHKCCQPPFSFC